MHGQYAKDSVIRDPRCAGREVRQAVNTCEECPALSVVCPSGGSAAVNTDAAVGFKHTSST